MTLAPGDTVVFTARSAFAPKSILAFQAGDIGKVVRCNGTHAVVLIAGVQAVAPSRKLQRVTSMSGPPSDRRVPRRRATVGGRSTGW
jgi:hypothetical protein